MKNKNKINYFLKADVTAKNLSIFLALCLLTTTVPALAGAVEATEEITLEKHFGVPEVVSYDNNYVKLVVDGASYETLEPGEPMLPKHTEITEIPFGSTDIDVTCTYSTPETMVIDGTVAPGPIPVPQLPDREYRLMKAFIRIVSKYTSLLEPKTPETPEIDDFDENIYDSHAPYGGPRFDYEILVGLNDNSELTTFVVSRFIPAVFSDVADGELSYVTDFEVTITYNPPSTLSLEAPPEYIDLLILSPRGFINDLQPLVDHKEAMGFTTKLVSLDEIYGEQYFENSETYSRDNQEIIKYFIYNAKLEWSTPERPLYVMLVGGWRTFFGLNNPNVQFPVRFTNNADELEPGTTSDQYYSCIIRHDEELDEDVFDDWDTNGNGKFAEWNFEGWDWYDPIPDVHIGRLACRNRIEVRTVVDKIIYYETNTYGEEWFNHHLSVTGDGFQDLGYSGGNPGFTFDINQADPLIPDGDYTIYAQSNLNGDPDFVGPIDEVHITVDRAAESKITFVEDDHLKIMPLDEEQETLYPGKPVAEIVIPSDEDVLGNTNVGPYVPSGAYIGEFWAVLDYTDGVLQIRTKSYDPSPHALHGGGDDDHGSHTDIHVWINDSQDNTVFDETHTNIQLYYEGEMEAGEGSGGAIFYVTMPPDVYEAHKYWTSNGGFYTMTDCLNAFSEGYGLAYVNGHSSCMVYGDHYPGIPGGRRNGQVNGWATINLQYGLERYQAEYAEGDPLFPLDQLTNGDRLPVLLYSGCHSGQFDTSFASMLWDPYSVLLGDRYATWTPEAVAWWLVRMPQGGSIATIGNAGYGSGYLGRNIKSGLTGWIFPHFFMYYKVLGGRGAILGDVFTRVLIEYHLKDDAVNTKIVRKHWEQLDLLGDPTLKIGGYPPEEETGTLDDGSDDIEIVECTDNGGEWIKVGSGVTPLGSDIKITTNPATDTNPGGMVSSEAGEFCVGYEYETPNSGEIHPGFTYSAGGGLWTELIWAGNLDSGVTSLYTWFDTEGNQHYIGSVCFGSNPWGVIIMPDITDHTTWYEYTPYGWVDPLEPGRYGMSVTAGYDDNDALVYAGVFTWSSGVYGDWIGTGNIDQGVAGGSGGQYGHFAGDCDQSTGWHFWVFEKEATNRVYTVWARPYQNPFFKINFDGANPDVAADDGWTYVVYENGGSIECRHSSDNGSTWDTFTVTADGSNPKVLINDDGSVNCYYLRDSMVYTSSSDDNGETWNEIGQIGTTNEINASIENPFEITHEGMAFDKGDGDLYANVFISTTGVTLSDMEVDEDTGLIVAEIVNSGNTYIDDLEWEIKIEGDSPLGEYIGQEPGQLLYELFRGRILSGGFTSGETALSPFETQEIASNPVFGIGHVMVTITVTSNYEVVAEKAEDGFLLGGRILLYYNME